VGMGSCLIGLVLACFSIWFCFFSLIFFDLVLIHFLGGIRSILICYSWRVPNLDPSCYSVGISCASVFSIQMKCNVFPLEFPRTTYLSDVLCLDKKIELVSAVF
jgi:hypothetical protein